MNKIQLGLILIFSAVIMNMLGRIFSPADPLSIGLFGLVFIGIIMIASVVVFLFGVFQLVIGLVAKYRSPNLD